MVLVMLCSVWECCSPAALDVPKSASAPRGDFDKSITWVLLTVEPPVRYVSVPCVFQREDSQVETALPNRGVDVFTGELCILSCVLTCVSGDAGDRVGVSVVFVVVEDSVLGGVS